MGSILLTQAMSNASDNHDIFALRLCILEENAYDLNALNNNILNTFSRYNQDAKYGKIFWPSF
jgi:hypothetical protein